MADDEPRTGELTTVNYGWVKPTVDGSDDAWGGYLNSDLDGIDSVVHGIQTSIPTVPAASATAPVMDGTASAGSSAAWSRGDHIHPSDTTKYNTSNPAGYQTAANVTASLAPYALTANVPAGSASPPVMDSAANAGTSAAFSRGDHVHPTDTTRYAASNPAGYITAAAIPAPYVLPTASTTVLGGVKVDGTTVAISGGGVISAAGAVAVSAIAPSSPGVGSLWFDSNGGQMYVWYDDGNSSQWVPVVNQGSAPVPQAPVVPPPAAANWTHRNFTANTTLTDVTNGLNLADAYVSGTNSLSGGSIVAPATPYTIDFNLRCAASLGASSYLQTGVGWSDGTKAQAIELFIALSAAQAIIQNTFAMTTWSAFGTVVALGTQVSNLISPSDFWLRIADNGTTVTFSYGPDGVSYITLYSIAKSSGYLGASGYSNILFANNVGALAAGGRITTTLRSMWVH